MLRGTDNFLQNILRIQYEYGEYFMEYCQSHITLLWIWIMLWSNKSRMIFSKEHQNRRAPIWRSLSLSLSPKGGVTFEFFLGYFEPIWIVIFTTIIWLCWFLGQN